MYACTHGAVCCSTGMMVLARDRGTALVPQPAARTLQTRQMGWHAPGEPFHVMFVLVAVAHQKKHHVAAIRLRVGGGGGGEGLGNPAI